MSLYIVALSAAYIFILINAPLSLFSAAGHDDGLFITLGRRLFERNWLGQYDQFTLMKGPGYPAFLALSSVFGISTQLARSFFHCAAIAIFVAICHRFLRSHLLSGLLFTLLLLDPGSFQGQQLRIIRDTIYYAQSLLCIGLLSYAFLMRNVTAGVAGGLMFGWAWLTREEGIWLLPGILMLAAGGLNRAIAAQRIVHFAAAALGVAIAFGLVQVSFQGANRWYYGMTVGVDVKEANFVKALGAIQSVRSGGTMPFVSVTRAARANIYRISPAFASLASYLDGARGEAWGQVTCNIQEFTCGEIGSGVFLWTLRDAAASHGHYASPAAASAFFGKLADEITAACDAKLLECERQVIAEMPPATWKQLARLPLHSVAALRMILSARSQPVNGPMSLATADQLRADLRFLNYPLVMPPRDEIETTYTIKGWYRSPRGGWFSVRMLDADRSVPARVDRLSSPDIVAEFKDVDATEQRFMIQAFCSNKCYMRILTSDGNIFETQFKDIRNGALRIGDGIFFVDSISDDFRPLFETSWPMRLSFRGREFIMQNFEVIRVPILIAGLLAALACLKCWRHALLNATYIVSLGLWALAISRILIISLMDLTFTPALNPVYLAPANFMLTAAAILALGAWMQIWRYRAERGKERATP